MEALTAARVAAVTGGTVAAGDPARIVTRVSIDTRTLKAGEWFLAIRGERFDGHAFVSAALASGAAGVVVSDPAAVSGVPAGATAIVVAETVAALQALAAWVRRESGAKVTAITGSAGKTTTKEMTAAFLGRRYSVFRNRGNLNNHIGLPLSLLELAEPREMAVVELGMNHPGEIAALVRIADPDVRVWTNVGPAHLASFPSVEAIAEAKAEIFEGAEPRDLLVANADDARVMARVARFAGRVATFGTSEAAHVRASDYRSRGLDGWTARVHTPAGEVDLACPLVGPASLSNVLAATTVAIEFDVSLAAVAAATAALAPAPHRGEVRRLPGGITVVDDSYNSNPAALARALEALASAAAVRRVAVVGEMLELGPESTAWHEDCGRAAAASGVDCLVTVGGAPAEALGRAAVAAGLPAEAVRHVPTSEAAADVVMSLVRPGDVVLVKGSRGVKTEVVAARLAGERG